jgi:hypothetical protein
MEGDFHGRAMFARAPVPFAISHHMDAQGTTIGLVRRARHVSNGVTRWHGVCVSMGHVHSLPDTTMPTLAAFRRALYTLLSARFIELQKQQRRS